MDRDYAGELAVERLAAGAFQSRAHFIRSFRDAFGETPHRYLQRRRIERAEQIILAPLASPIIDPQNADRARDLLSKGYMGTIILSTPDCRATWTFRDIVGTSPRAFRTRAREEQQSAVHEKLLADGVEFTQEPLEQPYGIECVARDPFGNQIRIAQAAPSSAP
jgi:AraC-like DNA-binding protein